MAMASREQIPNIKSWCVTQSEVLSIVFQWRIKHFVFYTGRTGYSLRSDTFPSEEVHGTKWSLTAYPSGINPDHSGHVSLYLRLVSDNDEINQTVRYRCSVLDSKNKETHSSQLTYATRFDKEFPDKGWHKFIQTDMLTSNAKELLPNDTLTLHFELDLLIERPSSSGSFSAVNIPECRLGDDLQGLFEKELFSDVMLVANGEKFKVHKNILAARSAFFAAMFTSEMKEKTQDVVEIKDIDKDMMYNMLSFIYTGKLPTDASLQNMSDLLVASDKYSLERLKTICENVLCPQVNADNVSDLLVLADIHCASQLKATTMDFINNNMFAVIKSESWLSLMQSHPQLVNEVLEYHLQNNLKDKIK